MHRNMLCQQRMEKFLTGVPDAQGDCAEGDEMENGDAADDVVHEPVDVVQEKVFLMHRGRKQGK